MYRLILLLLIGLGIAMQFGGRDLSASERTALGIKPRSEASSVALAKAAPDPAKPAPVVEPVKVAAPVVAPTATPAPTPAAAAAAAPETSSVEDAVKLAMATDAAQEAPQENAATGEVAVADGQPDIPLSAPDAAIEGDVATAVSDAQVWYVNGTAVNVREGPSTAYPVVDQVLFGEAAEILSDPTEAWVKIRIQGDGIEGYVSKKFLQDSEPQG